MKNTLVAHMVMLVSILWAGMCWGDQQFEIIIGDGTETGTFPLKTSYHDARMQTIYRADEIGAAGVMTGLGLYVTQEPGQTMNRFTIRMKHTELNDYSTSVLWQADGWMEVYQNNETITETGWVDFSFSTPFVYDGIQNLMVDISFDNSSYTSDGYCRYSILGGTRSLYYASGSWDGDPLTWSGNSPNPNISNNALNLKLILTAGNLVVVPDLVGMTIAQAETELMESGLLLGTVTEGYSSIFPVGVVMTQLPMAGTSYPKGFRIDIEISCGEGDLSGEGTEVDPYRIQSYEDFVAYSNNPYYWQDNIHVQLECDIDLSPSLPGRQVYSSALISPYTGMGEDPYLTYEGIAYQGIFDGKGHCIKNLVINASGSVGSYLGLFGKVGSGRVKDVCLWNAYIEGSVEGEDPEEYPASVYIGTIAGYVENGTIVNCHAQGRVIEGDIVGGLVGKNHNGGLIRDCSSDIAIEVVNIDGEWWEPETGGFVGRNHGHIINSFSSGSIHFRNIKYEYYGVGGFAGLNGIYGEGIIEQCYSTVDIDCSETGNEIGGFVGYNTGIVCDCYATGNVSGATSVGGLVGENNGGEIFDSYSIGNVMGDQSIGGLVGNNEDGGTVSECFWDKQTSGKAFSAGGTDKTTEEMQTLSTFTEAGWYFVETWSICEGMNYPRFQWQISPADFVCPDGVNVEDLLYFSGNWLMNNCDLYNNYCGGADLDYSGTVDLADWAIFADNWLNDIFFQGSISDHVFDIEMSLSYDFGEGYTSSEPEEYEFDAWMRVDETVVGGTVETPGGVIYQGEWDYDDDEIWLGVGIGSSSLEDLADFTDGEYTFTVYYANGTSQSTSILFALEDGSPIPPVDRVPMVTYGGKPLHNATGVPLNINIDLALENPQPDWTYGIEWFPADESSGPISGEIEGLPCTESTAGPLNLSPNTHYEIELTVNHAIWSTNEDGIPYVVDKDAEVEIIFTTVFE